MEAQRFPAKRFKIGRCIYCLSTQNLSDEHAIPYSLGGDILLEDGSCDDCARVTSYLDGYLANQVFRDLRTHAAVQSRSGLPKELPATLIHGEKLTNAVLPIPQHPLMVTLPNLGKPGIFRGEGPKHFYGTHTHFWSWGRFPKDTTADGVHVDRYDNVPTFARAVAKIAHCSAVIMFGLGEFRPLWIPDVILGRYPYPLYLVGSTEPEPPCAEGPGHEVHYGTATSSRQTMATVSVRLFANIITPDGIGMPTYHVIAGLPGKASLGARRRSLKLPKTIAL